MKTFLTRINGIYTLMKDGKMIASDDIDLYKDYELQKLSTENCNEIFGIIDVEKLSKEIFPNDNTTKVISLQRGFIEGFNKGFELHNWKFEVEVEMAKIIDNALIPKTEWIYYPKLDENRCLIIKKIL